MEKNIDKETQSLNISEVKTAQKVGTILLTNQKNKKWLTKWCMNIDKVLKDKSGRVYLIVVDGKVYKIGGSVDKKGILGTIGWYENNAFTGGPSIRTHGIHNLIHQELVNGSNVEIYMIMSNKILAEVKGLFGVTQKMVSIDFKEMENMCKKDYIDKCGKYPKWNFQENGEKWPVYLVESCNEVNVKSATNRKKKTKGKVN
jgi:hypothetical protein